MTNFIERLAPIAIRFGKAANVLPSLILAQGILESDSGKSELATKANNLFGIKKGSGWTGEVYAKDSKEWSTSKGWYSAVSEFRKYASFEGAVSDLVHKYTHGLDWEKHNRYQSVVGEKEYKKAAQAIFNAGYATDPTYPEKLIRLIEQYDLTKYDNEGVDEMVTMKKQLVTSRAKTSAGTNGRKYITIHETANTGKGTGAQTHANLQSNGFSASWHWTVDDKLAIQSFPHTVRCWHAGSTPGNNDSIGIEICVNSDGDFKKAVANAAELVKHIMKLENIPVSGVVQHNKWSGKNCPTNLRNGSKGVNWTEFIGMVKGSPSTVIPASKPVAKDYLIYDDRGAEVEALQKYLNETGFPVEVGGYYNAATKKAVMDFQKSRGLVGDGIYGAASKAEMNKALKENTVKPAAPSTKEDETLGLSARQRQEIAATFKTARERGVFSSADHEKAIVENRMNQSTLLYLNNLIAGAALIGGERIK